MVTKQAIKNLKEKIKAQEKKRYNIIENLCQNKDFETNYLLYKNLVVEKSKSEFFGDKFDQKKFDNCKDDLCKIIKANTTLQKEPLSIFEPVIMCKKCNDAFFVDGKPCDCVKTEMSNILKKESNLSEFHNFDESNFDLFDNKKKYQTLYTFAKAWCDNPTNSDIINFGFFGNTGNGKTFLMQCMADRLIKNGFCIYFTTAFNMLDKIFKGNAESESELIKKFIDCDILFIDDLGTEKFFKNQNENYLYTIVNQRMICNKPIIFSTNLELQDFFERYGERIFSRLVNKQKSKIFWFEQKDLRLK